MIYLTIAGRDEDIELYDSMTDEDVEELIVSAAETSSLHILKLFTTGFGLRRRQLMRISANIPQNTPRTRYEVHIAAASLHATERDAKANFG